MKENKDILNRLRRIEGQVKGIQGMVEKETCCTDVLVQISAIRAAINKVGILMIENYAYNCLELGEKVEDQEKLKELLRIMNSFMK